MQSDVIFFSSFRLEGRKKDPMLVPKKLWEQALTESEPGSEVVLASFLPLVERQTRRAIPRFPLTR